ncbi:hypothetical protein NPIL_308761, partial [Nephila pilipes]
MLENGILYPLKRRVVLPEGAYVSLRRHASNNTERWSSPIVRNVAPNHVVTLSNSIAFHFCGPIWPDMRLSPD